MKYWQSSLFFLLLLLSSLSFLLLLLLLLLLLSSLSLILLCSHCFLIIITISIIISCSSSQHIFYNEINSSKTKSSYSIPKLKLWKPNIITTEWGKRWQEIHVFVCIVIVQNTYLIYVFTVHVSICLFTHIIQAN